MASEENQITKIGPLTPVFEKPELVQENIKKFRETCQLILDPKIDILIINGKTFIRKSGWNVLNQYFGVRTEPIKSWREPIGEDDYMITVVIQTSLGDHLGPARSASCTSMEMKEKHGGKSYKGMESHCYGMAETRAVGRASAAWYMVGDPSAEEVENAPPPQQQETGPNPPSAAQLKFLKDLGDKEDPPKTMFEAAKRIDELKKQVK